MRKYKCGWEGCGIAVRRSQSPPGCIFVFGPTLYLLYLDDSGSAANRAESHLVLGGFSVFERQLHWLSRELDKLAEEIDPSDPNAVEFHASEIFSGRTPPWDGM